MTTKTTYTISEYKADGKKLFKIEKPGMPNYFAKNPHEAGRELAHLDAEDHQLVFGNIKDFDRSTLMASYHVNRVLQRHRRSSIGGLEQSVRAARTHP